MIRQELSIEREHGTIRGWSLWPDGPPPRSAVILVHGFLGSADGGFLPWVADAVVGAGYAVVAWTCIGSGFGASGRRTDLGAVATSTHTRELADLGHVVGRVREGACLPRPPHQLALLGHGGGAAHALLHAAADPGIDALVTWAAPAELDRFARPTLEAWERDGRVWIPDPGSGRPLPIDADRLEDLRAHPRRLDPLAAAARVRLPWLLVQGRHDLGVDETEARRLADACPHARLLLLDGVDHRFDTAEPFAGPSPALLAATEATIDHLRRYLAT